MAGMRLSGGGDVLDSKPINARVRTRALRAPILEGIRGVCVSGRWQAMGDLEDCTRVSMEARPGARPGDGHREGRPRVQPDGREGSQHGKLQE